jgi:hypothetical protein
MTRSNHRKLTLTILALALLCATLGLWIPGARAQAPAPDGHEPNNTLIEAATIPMGAELTNLTISPSGDVDWFRVLVDPPGAYPGAYRIEVIGTPGIDLTLSLYDPNAAPLDSNNAPSTPNASVAFTSTTEGYYAIEVANTTSSEGWYVLRVVDLTPAPTLTPTATGTPIPTPTSPFPTNTPTPALGGPPDYAEPNFTFAAAYRIVPGDVLTGLNFNSGVHGQVDNDFFVMAVRQGITYTCETRDLGPSVDTNLILYWSASASDAIGGSDDIDTQSGQIASRVTFTSQKEGDIYILVGYKFPETEDIPFPGAATYTLTCFADAPTPPPAPFVGPPADATPRATPLSIQALQQPETAPTPTAIPVTPQTIDVLVGYDRNDNGEVDPNEGVRAVSVRVVDVATNRERSHGVTGEAGTVRFVLTTQSPIRVVIPFLGAAEEFRPGSPVQWTILIPAANAPGLIP